MVSGTDYATTELVGIVPTGVYSLKPWVNHYNTHTYKDRTTTGSRRAEVSTSDLDIWGTTIHITFWNFPTIPTYWRRFHIHHIVE